MSTFRLLQRLGLRRLASCVLGLAFALALARFGSALPFDLDVERAFYDLRVYLTAPAVDQDPRVLLVTFQNSTLRLSGKRSPLDRLYLARALSRLDGMGARGIGIDILLDSPQAQDDPVLVAQLHAMHTPTFVAFARSDPHAGPNDPDLMEPWQEAYLADMLHRLAGGGTHPASVFMETDDDGVIRAWPRPKPTWGPRLIDALSPGLTEAAGEQGAIRYRRPRTIDQKLYNELPIEFFGGDAPEAEAAAQLLKSAVAGRYVLIGADIPGVDEFPIPSTLVTRQKITGVESHANLLAQRLDGVFYRPIPADALWAVALALTAAGALAGASRSRWHWAAAVFLNAMLVAALPIWLQGQQVDTEAYPALSGFVASVFAAAVVGAAARSLTSEQRAFAQHTLGRYIPADVAREILDDPHKLVLSGERREIFVVFTDLEAFTPLTHHMEAEALAVLLNAYLQTLSEVVLAHSGTLDKFVGDAVIAFWGAPLTRADDGRNAASAALALSAAGESFRRREDYAQEAVGRTRVGLHFGGAVVGNFGGEGRIAYTALGDGMNTAARLESANKQLGTTLLASREAVERSGLDVFRCLGRIVLKGRATALEVFEAAPAMDPEALRRHNAAWADFDGGQLDALQILKQQLEDAPEDDALAKMIERLEQVGPGGAYVLPDK